MEVMPGYKQTEVGMIPEDWEVRTIQELINEQAVIGHLDGNHGELYPRSHEFTDNGVPYITANDLGGRMVSFKRCKFLSEERARRFRKGIARDGDVLFAHNATVGPTSLLSTNLDYVILSTTATYFRCNPEKLCNTFVLYLLQSPSFVGQYRAVMAQSTRNQVPITMQRKLSVALPPTKAEQEAIAEVLSKADTLVECLERLIAKKRLLKRGVIQKLLTGKQRLPGFANATIGYKQTEVGVIPEDWEVKSFGDLFNFSGGLSASRDQLSSEGYCYLHYGDIHKSSKTFIDVQAEYQDIPKLNVPLKRVSSGSLLSDGDVVLVDASEDDEGTSKHVVIINKENIPYISGLHTIVAKSKTAALDHTYRRYCFQTANIKRQFRYFAVGTKVSGISKTNIAKVVLPIPPLPEQEVIGAILSAIDAEIALLEAQLYKYHQLKQGLMQKLLTGRIRLV